jgi:hypothetical protein
MSDCCAWSTVLTQDSEHNIIIIIMIIIIIKLYYYFVLLLFAYHMVYMLSCWIRVYCWAYAAVISSALGYCTT